MTQNSQSLNWINTTMQALLIKWALDSVMQLLLETVNSKVADTKSKVDNKFAKVLNAESELIKEEIVATINKRRKKK